VFRRVSDEHERVEAHAIFKILGGPPVAEIGVAKIRAGQDQISLLQAKDRIPEATMEVQYAVVAGATRLGNSLAGMARCAKARGLRRALKQSIEVRCQELRPPFSVPRQLEQRKMIGDSHARRGVEQLGYGHTHARWGSRLVCSFFERT